MSTVDPHYVCRVCGFLHDTPIWNDFGQSLLDESCICCGVYWGVDDTSLDEIRQYRMYWLANGAKWKWPLVKPDDWELEEQLTNIPRPFR